MATLPQGGRIRVRRCDRFREPARARAHYRRPVGSRKFEHKHEHDYEYGYDYAWFVFHDLACFANKQTVNLTKQT